MLLKELQPKYDRILDLINPLVMVLLLHYLIEI